MMRKLIIFLIVLFVGINFTHAQKSFTGTFSSLKGVMNSLSCYCYNSGYFSYGNDEKISVCSKIDDEEIPNNETITIFGHFELLIHESGEMDACPSGERTVFIIERYETQGMELYSDWNGKWKTNFGEIKLQIEGEQLKGKLKQDKFEGTLRETEMGTEVRGEWNNNGKNCWFWLYKETKNNYFTGEWGYSDEEGPAEGEWNGQKISNN